MGLFSSAAPFAAPPQLASAPPGNQGAAASSPTSPIQQYLIYALLLSGTLVRLFHYCYNRSFFIDELFLNVSVIKKTAWELATQPLAYEQKAPVGYLWASRFFVMLLGEQEPALRLFPLLCGLGALGLFVPVARYFLRGWGPVLAVGVLALAYPLIYHAVEAKQYSTELLATVIALRLYLSYKDEQTSGAFVAWGALGAALPWFSFSVIFVLAAIGVVISLEALLRRNWPHLRRCLLASLWWLGSFGLVYYFFLRKYRNTGWLTDFFRVRYDAFPVLSQPGAGLKWLAHKAYLFLDHPLGLLLNSDNNLGTLLKHFLKLGWVPLPLLAVGAYCLFRQQRRSFAVLALPFFFVLLAAAAGQYPFHERFTLFSAPLAALIIGYGMQQVTERYLRSAASAGALLAVVLLPSAANSARQTLNPDLFYNRSYGRQLLLYVNDHFQPGDVVYVYWNMQPGYEYYQQAYKLRYSAIEARHVKNQSVSQADYLRKLAPDFAAFAGKKRLWFVYDTNLRDPVGDFVNQPAWYYDPAFPPGRQLNRHFAGLGQAVDFYHRENYCASLYELAR